MPDGHGLPLFYHILYFPIDDTTPYCVTLRSLRSSRFDSNRELKGNPVRVLAAFSRQHAKPGLPPQL
jgi:hypothetical protein